MKIIQENIFNNFARLDEDKIEHYTVDSTVVVAVKNFFLSTKKDLHLKAKADLS